jgi:glycosyltransferase involved in cell wall biosynthesis|tara:strand:+ start:290 stop:1582 length:1293 start_codon:yes stop_codon:yes gene_type:complete
MMTYNTEDPMQKKKILMLSDHLLSTSGVGNQSRFLAMGLVEKGHWTVRQLGAAIKHENYDIHQPHPEIVIKPVDGFGNRDMLRQLLATEKPDLLLLFTDPRFFIWVWEMEDEIHQVCPIAYWHVWDNDPYPSFNGAFYQSTDLINCHSFKTYELVSEHFPDKTNFIPHALPEDVFYPLPEDENKANKKMLLGEGREDHFVGIWVNRNAKRKRPNDILVAWKNFLEQLQENHGHQKATLIMHTDPYDQEGPNLYAAMEMLGIAGSVFLSPQRVEFNQMNMLHNISDFCINIALNEGFGLPTLEAMQCGKPIIAQKTGGLIRQVVDHRDGSENGFALDPDVRTLVGSQLVPFIYEDYCTIENTTDAIMKLYELGPEKRKELGQKARDYATSEFSLDKTIDLWDKSLLDLLDKWENNRESVYKSWRMKVLGRK